MNLNRLNQIYIMKNLKILIVEHPRKKNILIYLNEVTQYVIEN
jgi:hypothetical protein